MRNGVSNEKYVPSTVVFIGAVYLNQVGVFACSHGEQSRGTAAEEDVWVDQATVAKNATVARVPDTADSVGDQ